MIRRLSPLLACLTLSCETIGPVADQLGASPAVVAAIEIGEETLCVSVPKRFGTVDTVDDDTLTKIKRIIRRACDQREGRSAMTFAQMEIEAFDCIETQAYAFTVDPDDAFRVAWYEVCRPGT